MSAFSLIPGQGFEARFFSYREQWETRHLLFQGVDHGSNAYYPEAQWMLRCWDVERGEPRSFPLSRLNPETVSLVPIRPELVVGVAELASVSLPPPPPAQQVPGDKSRADLNPKPTGEAS